MNKILVHRLMTDDWYIQKKIDGHQYTLTTPNFNMEPAKNGVAPQSSAVSRSPHHGVQMLAAVEP